MGVSSQRILRYVCDYRGCLEHGEISVPTGTPARIPEGWVELEMHTRGLKKDHELEIDQERYKAVLCPAHKKEVLKAVMCRDYQQQKEEAA